MAAEHISAEKYNAWLTPQRALEMAAESFNGGATVAILERLRGGLIQAAAKDAIWDKRPDDQYVLIPRIHWLDFRPTKQNPTTFWRTSDVRLFLHHAATRNETPATVRYFGVRLEPSGVSDLIAIAPRKAAPK